MNRQRVEMIRNRLTEAFEPDRLEIEDESHKHVGHPGARSGRGHFNVEIVSTAFVGKSLLERHRMVYDALGEAMHTDIHALSVKAKTPDEIQ